MIDLISTYSDEPDPRQTGIAHVSGRFTHKTLCVLADWANSREKAEVLTYCEGASKKLQVSTDRCDWLRIVSICSTTAPIGGRTRVVPRSLTRSRHPDWNKFSNPRLNPAMTLGNCDSQMKPLASVWYSMIVFLVTNMIAPPGLNSIFVPSVTHSRRMIAIPRGRGQLSRV
jgi:hypothetical protein